MQIYKAIIIYHALLRIIHSVEADSKSPQGKSS